LLTAYSGALFKLCVVVVVRTICDRFGSGWRGDSVGDSLLGLAAAGKWAKEAHSTALFVFLTTLRSIGGVNLIAGEVGFESHLEGFVIVLELYFLFYLLFNDWRRDLHFLLNLG
jgi:hypothetical protein